MSSRYRKRKTSRTRKTARKETGKTTKRKRSPNTARMRMKRESAGPVPGYCAHSRSGSSSIDRVFWRAFLGFLVLSLAISAGAQDKKGESQLRTVHGSTVDKNDNPIAASVVYLLNVRTQSVITRITDDA